MPDEGVVGLLAARRAEREQNLNTQLGSALPPPAPTETVYPQATADDLEGRVPFTFDNVKNNLQDKLAAAKSAVYNTSLHDVASAMSPTVVLPKMFDAARSMVGGVADAVAYPGKLLNNEVPLTEDSRGVHPAGDTQAAAGIAGLMGGSGIPRALAADVAGGTELGIFGGRGAVGADLANSRTAERLLDAGQDPLEVLKSTGWFKGADGKLRFEISDHAAKLSDSFKTDLATLTQNPTAQDYFNKYGVTMRLDEALQHDDLFKAYPRLAKMNFRIEGTETPHPSLPAGSYAGYYDAATDTIGIAPETMRYLDDPEFMKSMLHEAQHAVQKYEHFERGAAPSEFARTAPETEQLNQQLTDFGWAKVLREQAEQKAWQEHGTDLDGLNYTTKTKLARAIGNQQRRAHSFGDTGPSLEAVKIAEHLPLDNLKNFHDELTSTLARAENNGKAGYRGNIGEHESRVVEDRMNMTPEQRRENLPPVIPFNVNPNAVNMRKNGIFYGPNRFQRVNF